jgi:hypothetical protein
MKGFTSSAKTFIIDQLKITRLAYNKNLFKSNIPYHLLAEAS